MVPTKNAERPIDKFETLCYVKANISEAPYATSYGTVGHRREYGIILLEGLTELKVRLCWIDLRTVRAFIVLYAFIYLARLPSGRA